MNYAETEIVADAGTRLRVIAEGMVEVGLNSSEGASWIAMARHVDEVRVRLCALPLEAEGEAA